MSLKMCECLNDCGDDPDLWKGASKPCATYTSMMQRKRLIDAAPDLLAALKVLLRDVEMVRKGNVIDDGIELEPAIYQARKAIELAEKVRS
jgi:hypothetical protein